MCAMMEKLRRCWFSAGIGEGRGLTRRSRWHNQPPPYSAALRFSSGASWTGELAAEPLDRGAKPAVEGDAGLPAEQRAGAGDVRAALAGVVLRERTHRSHLAPAPRRAADRLGELEQRELVGVAQVHGQPVAALPDREQAVDQVVHVAEAARLRAVAEDGEILAADGLR